MLSWLLEIYERKMQIPSKCKWFDSWRITNRTFCFSSIQTTLFQNTLTREQRKNMQWQSFTSDTELSLSRWWRNLTSASMARIILHKSALFWQQSQERDWLSLKGKIYTRKGWGNTRREFKLRKTICYRFFHGPKVPNLYTSTASQIRAEMISILSHSLLNYSLQECAPVHNMH